MLSNLRAQCRCLVKAFSEKGQVGCKESKKKSPVEGHPALDKSKSLHSSLNSMSLNSSIMAPGSG